MFDNLSDLEDQTEQLREARKPSEEEEDKPYLWRWSPIIAMLVFCSLYFPLRSHPWSWLVAIASSYSILVFIVAFNFGFKDSSDFFGDSRAPKYVVTLLLPHALFLALIILGAYLWRHLVPTLPHWMTIEDRRRGSLWENFGLVFAGLAGLREGLWMARRIKHWLENSED
jgi:hypothetical protein